MTPPHFVSASCRGVNCGMCIRLHGVLAPATHKVGEEIMHDDPAEARHNLTQYVCCKHYCEIMGPFAENHVCFPERSPVPQQELGDVEDD